MGLPMKLRLMLVSALLLVMLVMIGVMVITADVSAQIKRGQRFSAKRNCPVSRALASVPIELTATLASG